MKYIMLAGLMLASCASPAVVTPKPDVAPIRQSNIETRKSIASTKKSIDAARKSNEQGASSLKDADDILTKLLGE